VRWARLSRRAHLSAAGLSMEPRALLMPEDRCVTRPLCPSPSLAPLGRRPPAPPPATARRSSVNLKASPSHGWGISAWSPHLGCLALTGRATSRRFHPPTPGTPRPRPERSARRERHDHAEKRWTTLRKLGASSRPEATGRLGFNQPARAGAGQPVPSATDASQLLTR
jgi:hypothetical protein